MEIGEVRGPKSRRMPQNREFLGPLKGRMAFSWGPKSAEPPQMSMAITFRILTFLTRNKKKRLMEMAVKTMRTWVSGPIVSASWRTRHPPFSNENLKKVFFKKNLQNLLKSRSDTRDRNGISLKSQESRIWP